MYDYVNDDIDNQQDCRPNSQVPQGGPLQE